MTVTHWTDHGLKPSRAIGVVTFSDGSSCPVYRFALAVKCQDAAIRGYDVETLILGDGRLQWIRPLPQS